MLHPPSSVGGMGIPMKAVVAWDSSASSGASSSGPPPSPAAVVAAASEACQARNGVVESARLRIMTIVQVVGGWCISKGQTMPERGLICRKTVTIQLCLVSTCYSPHKLVW